MINRYSNPVIMQTWLCIENSIRNADKIVLIGYSMPDDDYYTKYIVARSLAINKNKAEGSSITVQLVTKIRPSEQESEMKERYDRFLENRASSILICKSVNIKIVKIK